MRLISDEVGHGCVTSVHIGELIWRFLYSKVFSRLSLQKL